MEQYFTFEEKKQYKELLEEQESRYNVCQSVIDDLYNLGSGSWDTFEGKRIDMLSWWGGEYRIDGLTMCYGDAIRYLAFGEIPT